MRRNTICGEYPFATPRRCIAFTHCTSLTIVSVGKRCEASCKELNYMTVGRSVRTTPARVYLSMTWALCRIDQVLASPTFVRPFTFATILTPPHVSVSPSPHSIFYFFGFLLFTRHTPFCILCSLYLLRHTWSSQTHRCHLCNSCHRVRASLHTIVKWHV